MKVVSSLKSLKKRDKDCQIVRRHGRVFVINKKKVCNNKKKCLSTASDNILAATLETKYFNYGEYKH